MRRFSITGKVLAFGAISLVVGAIALNLWRPLIFFPSEEAIARYLERYTEEPNYERRAKIIRDLVTRIHAPNSNAQSDTMANTFRKLEDLYRTSHDEALLEGMEQPDLMGDTAMQRCFLYRRLYSDDVFRKTCQRRPRTLELVSLCKRLLGPESFDRIHQ